MDFANVSMVPKWVLVLTKAKLLGHNNDSTKPPQWLAMGPKGQPKGKQTDYVAVRPHATALPLAFTLAWPHTHTQTEGMCAVCRLRVSCMCSACCDGTC
jgi:hypothetical protein